MIIDCVSDLHGEFPKLQGGDLLVIAGDLTSTHTEPEFLDCFDWISEQNYRKKILIAGNHDGRMEEEDYRGPIGCMKEAFTYLCDSGTEFEGMKIWGSPWTKMWAGINPKCAGFTVSSEEELAEKWAMIPSDTDILITHSPPYGFGDQVERRETDPTWKIHKWRVGLGSKSLSDLYMKKPNDKWPKLWVFGHIHSGYGRIDLPGRILVNAAHMSEDYFPVNPPIRVEL